MQQTPSFPSAPSFAPPQLSPADAAALRPHGWGMPVPASAPLPTHAPMHATPQGWAPLEAHATITEFDPRAATGVARFAPVAMAAVVSLAALGAILWVLLGGGPAISGAQAHGAPAGRDIASRVSQLHDDLVPSTSATDGWQREHAGLWTSRADGSPVSVVVSAGSVGDLSNGALQAGARELVQRDLANEHLTGTIVSVTRRESTFGLDGGVVVRMHRAQVGTQLTQDFVLATDGHGKLFTAVATSVQGDATGARNARRFVDALRPA